MNMFITNKVKVENQLNKNIKILKFDRGGEYESNDFSELCVKFGIIHQTTAPYTSQQNGIAEQNFEGDGQFHARKFWSSAELVWGSSINCKLYSKQSTPQETWSYTI